jgi:hypothetical protein
MKFRRCEPRASNPASPSSQPKLAMPSPVTSTLQMKSARDRTSWAVRLRGPARHRSFAKDGQPQLCHPTTHRRPAQASFPQEKTVTRSVSRYAISLALLSAASPASADSCTRSIARVQAKVDAAIEARAGSGPWRPESVGAGLGYQPTPRSLAAAEAGNGSRLEDATNSLQRARAADRAGDIATCNQQLANARAILRQQRR